MRPVIDLPQFPMTEIYEPWSEGAFTPTGFVDQRLMYCEPCSHGKLETLVPPEKLYGQGYRTRTANSAGASQSVQLFHEFITRGDSSSAQTTVLDIGANDGSLLGLFPGTKTVAIDPAATWQGGEVIREFVEKADLSRFKGQTKLICSSHTLEHVERPEIVIGKLSDIINHGDTLALQFPSLDSLVRDARIDQVHHQHVHYFSLRSISLLLARFGLEITRHEFDDSHYGTLRLLARRGLGEALGRVVNTWEVRRASMDFTKTMNSFNDAVLRLRDPIGYGASLMLPVLRYYAPALEELSSVMDQDETKHGLRYVNFNKRIDFAHVVTGRDVVVTAFNTKMAVRKIAAILMDTGARNVVVPFHSL